MIKAFQIWYEIVILFPKLNKTWTYENSIEITSMLTLSLRRKYWKEKLNVKYFSYFVVSSPLDKWTITDNSSISSIGFHMNVNIRFLRGLLIDQHLRAPVVTWKLWRSRLHKRLDHRRRHVVPLPPLMGRHPRPDPLRHAGNRSVLQSLFKIHVLKVLCSKLTYTTNKQQLLLFQRPACTTWQNLWKSTLWRQRRSSGGPPRSLWSPTSASSSSKASRPPWSSAGSSHNC